VDYGSHPQHWLLFDRIVQQIVLQSENNETGLVRNPDITPIEINVKKIVHLLAKEEELVAARKKAEEMERENLDMSTKLAKKEQELDLRTQEKVLSKSILYLPIVSNLSIIITNNSKILFIKNICVHIIYKKNFIFLV